MKNSSEPVTITVHVPMTFAIRGGRKMILSDADENPGGGVTQYEPCRSAPRQRTENALLKAIAKAYRWRRQIESGKYGSITELAKAKNVNQSRLSCSSADASGAQHYRENLDGRGSADLMLKRIMKPLPVRWDDQIGSTQAFRSVSPESLCVTPPPRRTTIRLQDVYFPSESRSLRPRLRPFLATCSASQSSSSSAAPSASARANHCSRWQGWSRLRGSEGSSGRMIAPGCFRRLRAGLRSVLLMAGQRYSR
jgi:hypothetical protein